MLKVKTAKKKDKESVKKMKEFNVKNENRPINKNYILRVGELKVQIVMVKWCKYFTCACI